LSRGRAGNSRARSNKGVISHERKMPGKGIAAGDK
jgi:hypothetical protein